MISATSSFLSFSFRFFLLQILRFTMRDWLALPLSPSSPSSIKNNSDEDDCTYDIVNRPTDDDEDDEEQELSSWVTLLAVFGVVRHTSRSMQAKRKNRSTSASTISPDVLTEEEEVYTEEAIEQDAQAAAAALNKDVASTTESLSSQECALVKQEETGFIPREFEQTTAEVAASDDEYEQEISMKRSLSASSIASSSDSDNSTPACSQIMRPSKFFDEKKMAVENALSSVVQVSFIIIIIRN